VSVSGSLVVIAAAIAVVSGQAGPSRPAAGTASVPQAGSPAKAVAPLPNESHLTNLRQLTFGGENAEAYFSFDGTRLSFQSTRGDYACDQIYTMNVDGSDLRRVSKGGRTTCSYYTPDAKSVIYASTFQAGMDCPPKPSFDQGYVWPIYHGYDIYIANADGSNIRSLTTTPGYDAEATIRKDGRIVFTSVRDGDMEIYSMNADGSDVKRLTHREGPDGGPFYSPDGKQIVFRGRALTAGAEFDDYRKLLKQGLWRPTSLEIYVMNEDGSNVRQVTNLKAASFAPYFTPDGKQIIFASNANDPAKRNFEIYLINVDGTGLEQVTFNPTFDGFPMFSPDGKTLVFASNRHDAKEGETNVFIADWK
jgi:Tol biopolymer transport system component